MNDLIKAFQNFQQEHNRPLKRIFEEIEARLWNDPWFELFAKQEMYRKKNKLSVRAFVYLLGLPCACMDYFEPNGRIPSNVPESMGAYVRQKMKELDVNTTLEPYTEQQQIMLWYFDHEEMLKQHGITGLRIHDSPILRQFEEPAILFICDRKSESPFLFDNERVFNKDTSHMDLNTILAACKDPFPPSTLEKKMVTRRYLVAHDK
jgi:hypothetical protein